MTVTLTTVTLQEAPLPRSAIARPFGPRFPLLVAVGLAVAGRLALPVVPDPAASEASGATPAVTLASAEEVPPRVTPRPQPRPSLDAPIPLLVAPQSLQFLRAPLPPPDAPRDPLPGG